jgi:hypothetical protein
MVIEAGLATIAAAVAFGWPSLGSTFFSRIERPFRRLAQRKTVSVFVVGLATLLLRLALLPQFPVPKPFAPDDFSFLFSADTFEQGRLTNPTPAMWTHFETIHISMQPTYVSMYFPAQGLVLAAGKVLFGNPWFGILCSSALMCAAICWMLQAWLPPTWALLGGILAVVRIGLFSYWVNTYTGAGTTSALGGALVLGALPRFMKDPRLRHGMLLALGIAILGTTRPYEGMLLCIPVAVVLGRWLLFGKNRPPAAVLVRAAAAPLLVVVGAAAWLGYYDYRAFGKATTLPYTLNRAQYAVAPYYVWQKIRPAPIYRHPDLRRFYCEVESQKLTKPRNWTDIFKDTSYRVWLALMFFAGPALWLPLMMTRRVLLDRRIRFLVWCLLLLGAGITIEFFTITHYMAPFTAAFYAVGLQAMRHLRVWRPEGRMVGLAAVRLSLAICILLAGLRVFADPLHLTPPEWPAGGWLWQWYGPGHFGEERAQVEARLAQLPGGQVAIVRYSPKHYGFDEWVYNAPDVDNSKVIWAREMDSVSNSDLASYYKDRGIWLVEPDTRPVKVTPYNPPADVLARSK